MSGAINCGCDPDYYLHTPRGLQIGYKCAEHREGTNMAVGSGGLLQGRPSQELTRPTNPTYPGEPLARQIVSAGLPSTDDARKALPIWTGFVMYFPDVLAAVAEVSRKGNDQHNPGQPLHWAREKSTDQMNTAMRHMVDHARGNRFDTDGSRHLAKAIWRLCAELQLDIEKGTIL